MKWRRQSIFKSLEPIEKDSSRVLRAGGGGGIPEHAEAKGMVGGGEGVM